MSNIPKYLKEGDKVAVVATAKNFMQYDLDKGIEVIKNWNLEVVKGKHIYKKHHQFAGTDEERLHDLQAALDSEEIRAIFFARGGYGTGRIIDKLDFNKFIENPKWLIGFSDITVAHFHVQKLGFASIHGPMPLTLFKEGAEESASYLKNIIFGLLPNYKCKTKTKSKHGEAEGEVIGGNLSIINNLIGTRSDFDFSNKILFLEDVGEHLYHLDRMMVHLKRADKLCNLAGLVIGYFSEMKDNEVKFGSSIEEIILDAVAEYNFPVFLGFPAGHEPKNMPLLLGARARVSVTNQMSVLNYSL